MRACVVLVQDHSVDACLCLHVGSACIREYMRAFLRACVHACVDQWTRWCLHACVFARAGSWFLVAAAAAEYITTASSNCGAVRSGPAWGLPI